MSILYSIISNVLIWFKLKDDPTRVYPKHVKPYQMIKIQWHAIASTDNIGIVGCVNNDPKTKTMLLRIKWGNPINNTVHFEDFIVPYKHKCFRYFHLLNSNLGIYTEDNEMELRKQISDAIASENYEIIRDLQKRLDKLLNKK